MTESTPKSRLLFALALSLALHLLLFVLVGNIDWSRAGETTPYRGPLVVELVDPPVPPPPVIPPPPEVSPDSRDLLPVPEAVSDPAPTAAAANPSSPAARSRVSTPSRTADTPAAGGAYDDLFAGVTSSDPRAGRAAPEPVTREDQVSPRLFSSSGGLETAGVGTVTSGEQGVTRTSDTVTSDSLDTEAIKALEEALAKEDNSRTGPTPGPSDSVGEEEKIFHKIGTDSLIATRSLAERSRPLPGISLDEALREALRRVDQSVL